MKILIVEDYEDAALALGRLFQMAGYDILIAGDVQSANLFLQDKEVDAIVTDIGLPNGLSGFDLAHLLRNDPVHKNLPIVALTAFEKGYFDSQPEAPLFDAYLTKPASFRQIREAMQSAMVKRRAEASAGDSPCLRQSGAACQAPWSPG